MVMRTPAPIVIVIVTTAITAAAVRGVSARAISRSRRRSMRVSLAIVMQFGLRGVDPALPAIQGVVRIGDGSDPCGLCTNADDVERRDGSRETLQGELAGRLDIDLVFDLRVEPLRDQDLTSGRLIGQAGCEIGDRSDRRVIGATLEAHLPARGIPECDPRPEVEAVPPLPPHGR